MTKTVEEVRRELFEEWAERRWGGPVTRDDSEYFNPIWESEWKGFNAALDAVEIELPKAWKSAGSSHELMHKRDTIAAIEQTGLGLKVKP